MKTISLHAKRARLLALIRGIGEAIGVPVSTEEAIEANAPRYLWMDYAPQYGGYRVILVNVTNGGHTGALGQTDTCQRLKYEPMERFLTGVLWGLQHGSMIKNKS